MSPAGKAVSDYHNILIRVDKSIGNMRLTDDASPVLKQIQEKLSLRFYEADGRGQNGYNLDMQMARLCRTQEDFDNLEKHDPKSRLDL